MATAHVTCTIHDPGMNAVRNRLEWYVNGMVVASVELQIYPGFTTEVDAPEYSNVRLDVAAIGADGQMTWASSAEINTGAGPAPPPTPPPGLPSVSNPSVAYWW